MKITQKLEEQIGKDWCRLLKPFIESSDWDDIFIQLRAVSAQGKKIAPISSDTFNCFKICPPDKLKVVIVGMCPYHTFEDGKPIADGLCMSCKYTWKKRGIQPSLKNWYDEINRVYGSTSNPQNYSYGDLEWFGSQGILLYNVALTTEEGKPMGHEQIWSKFNKFLFEQVFNKFFKGIPMMFLGQSAQRSANMLIPMLHYSFLVSHPASVSYKGEGDWNSEGSFRKIDEILKQNNNEKIQWFDDLPF